MSAFQIIAILIAFAISIVAVAMTTAAVRSIVSTLKIGEPVYNRTDQPVKRTVTMLKETFLHTRMLQWHWVGIMHWFVYAGFLILSSAVLTGYFQLFNPEFALPIIGHWFVFEWASEFIGVLSTIGIVFLIIYRQRNMPRKKGRQSRFYGSRDWQAYFVEVMALLEGSAILFIRGAERELGMMGEHPEKFDQFHFPVSAYFGQALFSGMDAHALENTIVAIALIKIMLAMVWLIVISANLTMGVAWHRFTAWPNIWFKRESSGRTALGALKPLVSGGKPVTLDDIDDLDEDAPLGVGRLEDFSWKGILDFTTCTECGRCQSQCPAWNTEKPLSPKLLMMNLREHAYAKAPYSKAGGEGSEAAAALLEGDEALAREAQRPLVGDTGDDWFYMPNDGSAVIDEDVLWSCTSCGACVQQCPVDIEHVDHIVDMRRYQVLVESNFPAELNGLFKGLENKGNPWNMSPNARMDWAKGLDFEVPVVGETIESLDEVDWLFWVGCAGAYEDRAKKTTRATAELLNIAGISFGVLGNGETCTGDSARRAGNEFVFQGLAAQNVETLKEFKAKKVVSTCPHCMNTLKNEYKDFGIELEVIHHTQLLNRLVRDGKLTPVAQGAGAHQRKITYHDPCYLGRHNQVYSPPRELLQIMPGAEVKEMERNSERSFCCGAGGARMWMEETIGERINVNRTQEAVGTGADQIAVGCPFCRVMISDGLTSEQANGRAREEVEVLDVAQMLLASVKGEQATKLLPGEGADLAAEAAAKAAEKEKAKQKDDAAKQAAADEEAPAAAPAKDEDDLFGDASAAPATKAAPAAKQGGDDLFGDGDDLFGTPAPAKKTEKPAAAEKPASKAASKAAGDDLFGGDLFDTPAPAKKAERPAAADSPAPAKPAAASADIGDDLFAATPAPTKPKAPAEKAGAEPEAAAQAPTRAQPAAEIGDDLFGVEATPAPKKATGAEPAAGPAGEPASEAAPKPAKPAAEIGDDLFGIEAPEPAKPSAKAEPTPEPETEAAVGAEAAPAPAEKTSEQAKVAKPSAEITDDLFDIPAPAAPAPAAKAGPSPIPEPEAEESEPAPEAEATPEPEQPAQDTPDQPTPTPSNAPKPSAEITDDLFDIPAPAAPAPTAEAEPAPNPKPTAEPDAEDAPEPEPEPAPAEPEEPAKPKSGGATNTPRTDADIHGADSLFDL